ncbi:MAG: hypothetical protein KJ626_15260 [Verrucomicrobia bacterium]|nr:hypothetical protein [Verrucomicrobiota bacterium]
MVVDTRKSSSTLEQTVNPRILSAITDVFQTRAVVSLVDLCRALQAEYEEIKQYLDVLVQRRNVECLCPVTHKDKKVDGFWIEEAELVYYRWRSEQDDSNAWQQRLLTRRAAGMFPRTRDMKRELLLHV